MKRRALSLVLSITTALCVLSCGKEASVDKTDAVQFVDEAGDGSDGLVQSEEEPELSEEEIKEQGNKDKAQEILSQMTLEEKVGQMFITRPENQGAIPVGGICIFSGNITSEEGLKKLIEEKKTSLRTTPFIAVDEEGGRIARIANSGYFDVPKYASMQDVGSEEDAEGAKIVGRKIGAYLSDLGFSLDFAPVADVNTNPDNIVIGDRAFSSDPKVASSMVSSFIDGMHEENVMTTLKHFPGHGDTTADSHDGFVKIDKTWEELQECELIPYYGNLDKTDMVMVSHINTPNITSDERPASLSKEMIDGKLRGELGYDGVVITDGLEMGAITESYNPLQVGIYAVNAGVDILLLPASPNETYQAVLDAVKTDEISEERINESVLRILKLKLKYGVIDNWPNEVSEDFAVGAARTEEYLGFLKDKKVALLSNQTGAVGDKHTLDVLVENGVNVTTIFSPEHGFRGTASAGEKVSDSVDEVTGIPIVSLYGGGTVSASDMENIDVIVCDIQDVGVRFYTYYITMMEMMEKAASYNKKFIVFDRPNPNGNIVDGPVLDMKYKSGVGRIPVAACHGLTMGEIALMVNGEGWLAGGVTCDLTVIPCRGYTHDMKYDIPVAPSPNLPNPHAVALYPSLCGFEGTNVSIGRGTDFPFEVYGHPLMSGDFTFTPKSCTAAKNPPQQDKLCYGVDLRNISYDEITSKGFTLEYIIDAYQKLGCPSDFFGNGEFFDKLMGNSWVRTMILEGHSAEEIKAMWQDELNDYKKLREKYLIYN